MISAPLVAFCDNGFGGAAWAYTQPAFAGTPGKANCYGKSVSALAGQYGGLNAAAAALGFPSLPALQNAPSSSAPATAITTSEAQSP
jgi:hypothetical protein